MSGTIEILLSQMAEKFMQLAKEAITQKGDFTVALSGGSSPKKVLQILSTQYAQAIDWTKVAFFYGDERYVPSNSADFNGLMARENLLNPLCISDNQIFEVNTTLSPKAAAADYWQRIQTYFKGEKVVFDLIMLGLGDDAHTASLFPETEALDETQAKVVENFVPKLNTSRITFTYALINQAKNIVFLTFGESKANAVYHIFESEKNPKLYPAQLIQGNITWLIDNAASALLTPPQVSKININKL